MNQSNIVKAKPIGGALVVACVCSTVFFFVFPWFLFAFAIIPVPVVTEIVVMLVDIPVTMLGMDVPDRDSFGFKGNVAKWFWSPIFFLLIFMNSYKNRKKASSIETVEE